MIELRGIAISHSKGGKKIRLTIRGERGDDYQTLTFPTDKPLTKGAIISFLVKKLKVKPKDIKWAEHVKIPSTK